MTSPFRLFKPAISGMLAQAAGPMHVCLRVRRAACAHCTGYALALYRACLRVHPCNRVCTNVN